MSFPGFVRVNICVKVPRTNLIVNKCQFSIHSIPPVDIFQPFLVLTFSCLLLDCIYISILFDPLYPSSIFLVVAGERGSHILIQNELQ